MKQGPVSVSVGYHPEYDRLCRQLARRLGAPLLRADEADTADFRVEPSRQGLKLHGRALARQAPLHIDFDRPRENRGSDPLVRAIGRRAKTVLDATAGWGADAAHLARAGYAVIAVEKHPVVAALLVYAHARCRDEALRERLSIIHDDSITYLEAAANCPRPDVVYLDPMYPPSAKSAAAKKPLTILRMLAAPTDTTDPADDCEPLFAQALRRATQRVVIKRPRRAPPLYPGRSGEIGGKLVRFDIYKPTAR